MKPIYNYNKLSKLSNLRALTITELLLDLVLSTMVIAAVFNLYINYKRSYELQTDAIFLYQNAKSAYNYIKDDIKLAGFYGCNSDASSLEYAFTPSSDYELDNPVTAYEASSTGLGSTISLTNPSSGWSPAFAGQIASVTADDGSDMMTIKYADSDPLGILNTNTTGSSLDIPGIQNTVSVGDKLLISDCIRSVVFEVDDVETDTLIPTSSVGSLNSGAEVYQINVHSYYLKTENNITSLYRLYNGTEELIVPYVENIQLLYGQDTNNDGVTDIYNTANNLSNNTVTSISLGVVMRSINKHFNTYINNDLKLIDYPDIFNARITINSSNDNYIRKSFDFNINIPNTSGVTS